MAEIYEKNRKYMRELKFQNLEKNENCALFHKNYTDFSKEYKFF